MPSAITHIILSRKALEQNTQGEGPKINSILTREIGAYTLGCVAPDLPYMPTVIYKSTEELAGDIHTSRTNQIPLWGLKNAKEKFKAGQVQEAEALFALYAGYCSHLTADGIVHPFIRDMVGDYEVAQSEHRTIEIKLDVLIADIYFKGDCNSMDIHPELDALSDAKSQAKISAHYAEAINHVYPGHDITESQVKTWASRMNLVCRVVAHGFPIIYKDIFVDKMLSHQLVDDIRNEKDQLILLGKPKPHKGQELPFNHLNKPLVNLFVDVIPIYFNVFPKVLASAYEYVFEQGPVPTDFILEINLDTGRSLTSTNFNEGPAYLKLLTI